MFLGTFVAAGGGACSSSSEPTGGPECVYASDCAAPDVCVEGTCGPQCRSSADCADGYECRADTCERVAGGGSGGAAPECIYNSDCGGDDVCNDGKCAPECKGDRDCIDGYHCAASRCLRDDGHAASVTSGSATTGTSSSTGTGGGSSSSSSSGTGGGGGDPTCSDGQKNGDETDLDCGGACAPCASGAGCSAAADCASGRCEGAICQVAACDDGVQNGAESDTDCGGPSCDKCPQGAACNATADCAVGSCKAGTCAPPSCADGIKNGTETDADCGGACAPCDNTKNCAVAADCKSGTCAGQVCQAPSCLDGVKNGTETDKDCGGPACGDCLPGKSCTSGADCSSGVCKAAVCQSATCGDGIENGGETAPDCGGPACEPCADGEGCAVGSDCASGVCQSNACAATHVLTVERAGSGVGVVESQPAGIDCGEVCSASFIESATIALTATPAANSTFQGWSGGGCVGVNACIVTMDQAKSVTAQFDSANTGALEWEKTPAAGGFLGGAAIDGSGNVVFGGTFSGSMNLGGGPLDSSSWDAFVAKFTKTGAHVWSRRFGLGAFEFGIDVATDAKGDVILLATSSPNVSFGGPVLNCGSGVLAKYAASNGAHLWSRCVNGTPTDLALDPSGNPVVTGSIGDFDYFLEKYAAADGSAVWAKSFTQQVIDNYFDGPRVAVDASGNVAMVGRFVGTKSVGGPALTSVGAADIFVAKYNSSGTHQWSKRFGDTYDDGPRGVAFDAQGNIVVGGYFHGTIDFGGGPVTAAGSTDGFLLELTPSGGYAWVNVFGSASADVVEAVAVAPDGTVLATGAVSGPTNFGSGVQPYTAGTDAFVTKHSGSGELLWATVWGTIGADRGRGIAAGADGRAAVTGEAQGALFMRVLAP